MLPGSTAVVKGLHQMEFDWQTALGALAGGLFGAAIGGLPAFIFTGFLALVGVAVVLVGADYNFLGNITFGPTFGPHVTFCGGAAAAAYAARRGKLENGRDIATPLAGTADMGVMAVGALFGLGGYVAVEALKAIDFFPNNTDVIALVVGLSNVLARVLFGRTGILGSPSEEALRRGRFRTSDDATWVQWQEGWKESIILGGGLGIMAAWLAAQAGGVTPEVAKSIVPFGYALSAIALIFLAFDRPVPVTHHMTLMGALGAVTFNNILWGFVFGVLTALIGEFFSRLFLIHGDTHIDPPAWAIAVVTTIILVIAQLT
jgi:hypothetical protein